MQDVTSYLDDLVTWRRHLHRHPELSFAEHQTVAYIERELRRELPDAQMRNLTPTSLVVTLDTGKPGPRLGLRADIDALAIQEDRPDLEFASEVPGVMHGCGHDGHTAVVMATMLWVRDHLADLTGTVTAVFQHAEERPPGGAQEMVATGFFDDFDYMYGFHLWGYQPTGTIDIKEGPASANSDLFSMTIHGRGGHASMPQETTDPVILATQTIQQIQHIVSRRIHPLSPAVVSATWLQAGTDTALNVIPGVAHLGGSIRTMDDDARQLVRQSLEQIAISLQTDPQVRVDLDYVLGYDGVYNDPARTRILRGLAEQHPLTIISEPPMLGGEDFAAFAQRVPSSYVFVGAQEDPEAGGHHTPTFGVDEDSFAIAMALAVDVVRNGPELAAG